MPTAPNASATIVNGTIVTTAETIVATTTARPVSAPGSQGQLIQANVNITPGTGATAMTLRVRAGNSLTGALVGVAQQQPCTAAVPDNFDIATQDPTTVGTVQYSVTAQATSATGNSTVNAVSVNEETTNAAGA